MGKIYLIIFIEVIAILFVQAIIFYILKMQFAFNREKRLDEYSINLKDKYNEPWFDKQKIKIIKIIKKMSKILSYSAFLKKYSKHYNKFIDFDEKNKIKPMDYISVKFLSSFLLLILYIVSSYIQYKIDVMFILLMFVIGFFIPDVYLIIAKRKRHKELENNLLEAVIIMNNAFKSGKNILESIKLVKEELNGPLKEEFKKVYLDLTYGLDIDIVFNRFYERVKLDDIKYISSSLTLLNQTGGNIVKVFNSIENNFYDKKVLSEELDALTSSSKLMYKMLMFIPIVIVFVLFTLNPSYFYPLFTNKLGIFIIIISIGLYIGYAVIINRITKVKL